MERMAECSVESRCLVINAAQIQRFLSDDCAAAFKIKQDHSVSGYLLWQTA